MLESRKRNSSSVIEPLENRQMFSTYFVTTLGDGAGSVNQLLPGVYFANTLRAAVNSANAKAGSDVILLNPLPTGMISLQAANGQINITDNLTIQGFGANRQGVDGGGASRVFNISAGVNVQINDLTISNAFNQFTGGGGIRNNGNLTMRGVTVRNNKLLSADGGGVYSTGNLDVANSTFRDNSSDSAGGAIFSSGSAKITNCTFYGNTAVNGGALYSADNHPCLVSNSTFTKNFATFGGAIAGPVSDPQTITPGLRMNNTIVAGNDFDHVNGLNADLYGLFDSASSNNLIGDLGFAKGMDPTKNILGGIEELTPVIDAKLAPLGYYSGSTTQVMPLLAGSPALNAGKNALIPTGTSTDQRGSARIAGGTVDIGAVEGGTSNGSPFYAGLMLLGNVIDSLF